MKRLIFALLFLPTFAAADWSPRPLMFTYDATFEVCLQQPHARNLARSCEEALAAAYVLKRAVAWATFNCNAESIASCAEPFENEGLPAIAARIAVDTGCVATDVLALPEGEPIPPDHCITVASDIMIDEGVVPLSTEISCGIHWIECGEIAQLNAAFWADQVDLAAPDDLTVSDLQARNFNACGAEAAEVGGWATELNAMECLAARSAELWADLADTTGQEN